jgi:hypothetical protein
VAVPADFAADRADVISGAVEVVELAPADVEQGGTAEALLLNVNPAYPFDDKITVDADEDISAAVTNLSGGVLTVEVTAFPSARRRREFSNRPSPPRRRKTSSNRPPISRNP